MSDIERGARNPTILIVEKLAKSLGVTAGELLD
ncbi:transcriptional regulator with XRE-family HTH domain [Sphingomonas sp. PL20]